MVKPIDTDGSPPQPVAQSSTEGDGPPNPARSDGDFDAAIHLLASICEYNHGYRDALAENGDPRCLGDYYDHKIEAINECIALLEANQNS